MRGVKFIIFGTILLEKLLPALTLTLTVKSIEAKKTFHYHYPNKRGKSRYCRVTSTETVDPPVDQTEQSVHIILVTQTSNGPSSRNLLV